MQIRCQRRNGFKIEANMLTGMATAGPTRLFHSRRLVLRRGRRPGCGEAAVSVSVAFNGLIVVGWPMRRDRPA